MVSRPNLYIECAVLGALSPPVLRFVIGSIFIESLGKTGHFREILGLILQRLDEYSSDRKSATGM